MTTLEVPRLYTRYRNEVLPKLKEELGLANIMAVPRLHKIVVSMGVKEGATDIKALDQAAEELSIITGQKPKVCRARKSVAGFKLREGSPIGLMVTLRSHIMFEFLDRLISVAIPRVRDFRGVPASSFDGRGNYSMGVLEQIIFPEIEYDKIPKVQGLNITFVTSASKNEEGKKLLELLGMPFRKK